jgi:ABC-type transport system involved in multi-copper enzyme maturation permease subunit
MSVAYWKSACAALKTDALHFYPGAVGFSLLWLAMAPLLFGIRHLDAIGAAIVLERYAALIGLFLFPPVLAPEREPAIREVVEAKPLPRTILFLGRFALSTGLLVGLLGGFVLTLRLCGGSFPAGRHLLGAFATALLLGSLCLCTLAVSGQLVAAYLPPLVLYMLCLFLGARRMGILYLFGLSADMAGGKGLLIIMALALAALALAWQALYRKIR